MPEFSPILAGIGTVLVALGALFGWFIRAKRIRTEKAAIHSSWHDQISAQKQEHDRLAEQNKSLMEQVAQYRASKKNADERVVELSEALRDSEARRADFEKELRQTRSNLEVALRQRELLKRDLDGAAARAESLKDKDQKIFRLSRELESWQNRLPPLLEKYRSRDLEAQQLEVELEKANARIAELDGRATDLAGTRIEPVEDAALAANLDASNEQFDDDTPYEEPQETETSDSAAESTGLETYLEEGTVDFDLGAGTGERHDADPSSDASLVDVFVADGGAAGQVDELLESGSTSAIDTGAAEFGCPSNGNGRVHDDLQRIKGVGPAIEKTLNDLGYYRYEQIAGMSESDIDRVSQELRGFRSRIYREDWIGQARVLTEKKAPRPH